MKVVHKISLVPAPYRSTVFLPEDAKVLRVSEQQGQVSVWYLADQTMPAKARTFQLVETGVSLPDDFVPAYVGTAILQGGSYVLHLFELI